MSEGLKNKNNKTTKIFNIASEQLKPDMTGGFTQVLVRDTNIN